MMSDGRVGMLTPSGSDTLWRGVMNAIIPANMRMVPALNGGLVETALPYPTRFGRPMKRPVTQRSSASADRGWNRAFDDNASQGSVPWS